MLIKSLDARNFRKYHKLIINDIPESGIITVSGPNEAGKTSIGEAICFALFGRTFFQDETSLHKIVCWGTEVAEVTVVFKAGDGNLYTLWRSVDSDGKIKVKLNKHNEDVDIKDDKSSLKNKKNIEAALPKLLGFDFDAFSNSFYLAQRELTSPDPQSYSIKQMAGIAAYSKITDDLEKSNQVNLNSIEELQPQLNSNQTKLDEINLDETWLPELIESEETLSNEIKRRNALLGDLNDNEQTYGNNFNSFHSAKKSLVFFGLLTKLFLVTSIILGVLWGLYTYYPENLISTIADNFADPVLTHFVHFAEKWLVPAALTSLGLLFLSWIISSTSKSKMTSLNEEAKGLSNLLDNGQGYVTTMAESVLPERVVKLLNDRDSESLQALPPSEKFENLTDLISNSIDYKAAPEEMSAATTGLSEVLKQQDKEVSDMNSIVQEDINKEKVRSDNAESIKETLLNLNKTVDKCNYTIDTQTISIGIMQRAAADSIERFNQNISDVSANALPNFTQNRYSKLKIAEDFSVQIYSGEKNDYMDFDEISSGTQRQIMLSLRIAMSEQLSINSGNNEQFIFLDEPFAFFDKPRTISTLDNLPEVSDVINQIWISAQEFPDTATVARRIECPDGKNELIA